MPTNLQRLDNTNATLFFKDLEKKQPPNSFYEASITLILKSIWVAQNIKTADLTYVYSYRNS